MNQIHINPSLAEPDKDKRPVAYETDFALWLEWQMHLLRAGQFTQLDLDNLLEELEGMNSSNRREVSSRIEVILIHLLKCQFQAEKASGSWRSSIQEQRHSLEDLFEQSPSYRRLVPEKATKAYRRARVRAAEESNLPIDTFPPGLPWSPEQILDPEFLP